MTGEQIQALANALPPLPPKDLGPAVQGFALVFGIVSIIVVCLRIYVRAGLSDVSPRLLGLEDYLAVLSIVSLQYPSNLERPIDHHQISAYFHTRHRLRRPHDTLRRRIPRCQHPITTLSH